MVPDLLLVPPPRRRRWWRILLALFLLGLLAVVGGGWWALSTNQTGRLISHLFGKRLPGYLDIGHSEFVGLDRLVLSGVRLRSSPGAVAAVTVERIVISGELWKGEVERIRCEGMWLDSTADVVRFVHHLIQAEVAIPPSEHPRLLHLEFTGGVRVDGEVAIDKAQVAVAATGPQIEVTGNAQYGGQPLALHIDTSGTGDQLRYNVHLLEGRLPIWRTCDWLAALQLLPPLTNSARPWVPEYADVAGTLVRADQQWEHFTGDARARWDSGRGQGELQVDRRFIRLGRLVIRDEGLGMLDGQAVIDTDGNAISVSATTWSPGPRLPIPAIVPTASILAALPRAQLEARLVPTVKGQPKAWDLALRISGAGQATLAWAEGGALRIVAKGVALPLLQPFLPKDLTLAAGTANDLHAEIGEHGLSEVSGTVEQARVLWQGWALGSLDGHVVLRVVPSGIDLDVTLPVLGKGSWRAAPVGGALVLDITSAEALVVRLKGPQSLPDLTGALRLDAQVQQVDGVLAADISRLRLRQVGITDVLRTFDSDLAGTVRLHGARMESHLLGRLTSGELRLPGEWRDLAKRRPSFNAEVMIGNGVVLAEKILVRATDAAGEPLIDGYSAGLRGRFSLSELTGTVLGVVDHADLGWINTFIPIADGVFGGEGAVTFTANLVRDGIDSIDGHFLPLDAHLQLGQFLSATGIKGAVKFRLARPAKVPLTR